MFLGRPMAGLLLDSMRCRRLPPSQEATSGRLWYVCVSLCVLVMSQCDVIMTSLMGDTKAGIMIQICYTMHVEPLAIVCQVIGVP